jgi:hypothetical protein
MKKALCSLLGGKRGLATPTFCSNFDIKTPVRRNLDPVVRVYCLIPQGLAGTNGSFRR